jgi:hypothetical protein
MTVGIMWGFYKVQNNSNRIFEGQNYQHGITFAKDLLRLDKVIHCIFFNAKLQKT